MHQKDKLSLSIKVIKGMSKEGFWGLQLTPSFYRPDIQTMCIFLVNHRLYDLLEFLDSQPVQIARSASDKWFPLLKFSFVRLLERLLLIFDIIFLKIQSQW